jgi:predicted enzyme related to lactoylglutathione lyase
MSNDASPVFRAAGISYLHIPSTDPQRSAGFYRHVFGWKVGGNPERPSFEDGTGHVIGAWVTDRSVSEDTGLLAYVYVDDVDEVLDRVTTDGGRVVKPPYAEGDLRVATFRDPSGTVIGVWQQARNDT